MATNENITNPEPFADLESATIDTALAVSELAYDTYTSLGNLMKTYAGHPEEDRLELQLEIDGWTPIVGADNTLLKLAQNVSADSYQGVAFYKTINGVTEVIIGNRGSQ